MTIRPLSKAARLFRRVLGSSWSFVRLTKGSPFMNLTTTPTTGAAKPSPWLLKADPDLTPGQVWVIQAKAERHGIKSRQETVVIADTSEQVIKVIEEDGWIPLVLSNEAALTAQIAVAEGAPAYTVCGFLGRAGNQRFVCVFDTHNPKDPFRLKWVLASSENSASDAWHHLGESEKPIAIFKLADLVALRDKASKVRLERGLGASDDGREFPDRADRLMKIDRERIGEEKFDADIKWLSDRLHA